MAHDSAPRSSKDVAEKLARYAELLRGSPHNLLSAQGLRELEDRHFPESVAFAEGLPRAERLLDVGSGGGLPGVVIAIVRPDVEVHLLDATGKKAAFLRHVAEELSLPMTVHHGRAEELSGGELKAAFGLVTARAVARLDKLAGWCAPFLRPSGTLHAIKGERWQEELDEAGPVLTRLGLGVLSTPVVPGEDRGGGRVDHPLVVVLVRND
jgi:16S rRNA (guanine527-N7)-methyltransferase